VTIKISVSHILVQQMTSSIFLPLFIFYKWPYYHYYIKPSNHPIETELIITSLLSYHCLKTFWLWICFFHSLLSQKPFCNCWSTHEQKIKLIMWKSISNSYKRMSKIKKLLLKPFKFEIRMYWGGSWNLRFKGFKKNINLQKINLNVKRY